MARSPHSFNFFTANFVEAVRLFEPDEIGAYVMLLCHQWQHGHIPETDRERRKAAQVYDDDQWTRIWERLRPKFELVAYSDVCDCDPTSPDRHVLVNPRMHTDRNKDLPKYRAAVERAKINGSKGGRKPKSEPTSEPKSDPTSVLSETEVLKREERRENKGERSEESVLLTLESEILPGPLRDEAFVELFNQWCTVRNGKHHDWLDLIQQQTVLNRCRGWGLQVATEAVTNAIAGGWKNLRKPDSPLSSGSLLSDSQLAELNTELGEIAL